MNVLYICSQPRSGSTFLQLLLAGHPKVVGLGEIAQLMHNLDLDDDENLGITRPCSCDKPANECCFWGPLLPTLKSKDYKRLHSTILDRFQQEFPSNVLVDSSKSHIWLDKYYVKNGLNKGIDLKVLLLIRDFRGWALSVRKHRRKRGKWDYGYVINSYIWAYRNFRRLMYLKRKGLQHLVVSYEDLVFSPRSQLERICEFAGIPFDPEMLEMKGGSSHDIFGATMKNDPVKRTRITYDDSWRNDWRSVVAGPLVAPVYLFSQLVQKRLGVAEKDKESLEAVR